MRDDGHVHISTLKYMAQSPAHYKWALDHQTSSDATDKGSAVHSLVLGGQPVVSYTERRAGQAWKTFEAENRGAIILKTDAYQEAQEMAAAVRNHPAADGLLHGDKEVGIVWERAGRSCSSRLDVWDRPRRRIVDLKTCRSADPKWFDRTAIRMGYHAQLAWYLEAASWQTLKEGRTTLGAPTEAFIIAVESKPPYPVVVWKLTERALEAGRACCTAWFERLRLCEDADHWPGYTDAVQELDVADEEQELDFGGTDDSDS